MEVITMATESFAKTFTVDRRSEKCIERILKQTNPTIINQKRNCRKISKEELRKLFKK